jgi:phosphonate transport system substrate-binding protein
MPRRFLEMPEVGLDAERDFKAKPAYQTSASATLQSVGSGAFDVGVVDAATWKSASDAEKASAPVIYVTPVYKDACAVIHPRLGPVLPLRVMSYFVKLDPKRASDKAVLDTFHTKQFVPVSPKDWDGIREVYKTSKARGILQ